MDTTQQEWEGGLWKESGLYWKVNDGFSEDVCYELNYKKRHPGTCSSLPPPSLFLPSEDRARKWQSRNQKESSHQKLTMLALDLLYLASRNVRK